MSLRESLESSRKSARRGSESATWDGMCRWIGGRPAASAAASRPERILAIAKELGMRPNINVVKESEQEEEKSKQDVEESKQYEEE